MTIAQPPRVLAVSLGVCAPLPGAESPAGGPVLSAICKRPVSSLASPDAVAVDAARLRGDEQADLLKHGGPLKAVYAYPIEHYDWWQQQRAAAGVPGSDAPMPHGMMGENLTVEGLLEDALWIGDRIHVGTCIFQVESPRRPCYKFNAVMGYAQAATQMLQSGRSGFYLSIVETGTIRAGDTLLLAPGPRQMTVWAVSRQRLTQV